MKKFSPKSPLPRSPRPGQKSRPKMATASSLARQREHLRLAAQAQVGGSSPRKHVAYEPLLAAHPQERKLISFLGKTSAPLWISPLSFGPAGKVINQRLAKVAAKFKLGWMLGSMRSLLERMRHPSARAGVARSSSPSSSSYPSWMAAYQWRPLVGDIPLWANLGMAQLEQLVAQSDFTLLDEALRLMEVDGLVIHLNPLQEWWQPAGDRYTRTPIATLEKFLAQTSWPIIVKEVGQGLGPKSLAALLDLPLAALDLAGWGGTNFTQLESLRSGRPTFGLEQVGHTCAQMVQQICARPLGQVKNFILSGGQNDLPASFILQQQLKTVGAQSVVALGYPLLSAAQISVAKLESWVADWWHAWAAAEAFLSWSNHD